MRHRATPSSRSFDSEIHTLLLPGGNGSLGKPLHYPHSPQERPDKYHPSLPGHPLHGLQSEPEDSLSDLPHHLHGADFRTQRSPSQIRSDEGMICSCKPANSDTLELPARFLRTDQLGSLILSHKGRIHGLLGFWHFVYILTTIAWRSQTSSKVRTALPAASSSSSRPRPTDRSGTHPSIGGTGASLSSMSSPADNRSRAT